MQGAQPVLCSNLEGWVGWEMGGASRERGHVSACG